MRSATSAGHRTDCSRRYQQCSPRTNSLIHAINVVAVVAVVIVHRNALIPLWCALRLVQPPLASLACPTEVVEVVGPRVSPSPQVRSRSPTGRSSSAGTHSRSQSSKRAG